jgi:transposase
LVAEELRALQALTGEIRHQQRQLRGIERRICRVVDRDPEMSWLGATIGKVTAAEMVALGGRPTDYANASSLLKGLGVNLKERSSGKHKGELKITKRGPAPVRQGLYMASLRLLQKDAIVRAWYERKVAREAGRYKKKAVVAVMRKLIKALWWVARGEAFDASKLFDTKRLGLAG